LILGSNEKSGGKLVSLVRQRKAIRAILLAKSSQEILLIRCVVPDTGISHWVTPGGGINDNESEQECLTREVREETGYTDVLQGRLVWTRSCQFVFNAVQYDQYEKYFLVEVPRFEPENVNFADPVESDSFREFRWWTPSEILSSNECFIPKDMGDHLQKLLDGLTIDPVDVTD